MKKTIVLILILTLVLSLAACGSKDETGTASPPPTTGSLSSLSEAEINAIVTSASQGYAVDVSSYSQADLDKIESTAASQGYEIVYDSQGRLTFKLENSDSVESNGGAGGEPWPDNSFTAQIPAVDFGTLLGSNLEESGYFVAIADASLEQIIAYAEKVKAHGFTINTRTDDYSTDAVPAYYFEGENAAGYKFSIEYGANMSSMQITKYGEITLPPAQDPGDDTTNDAPDIDTDD